MADGLAERRTRFLTSVLALERPIRIVDVGLEAKQAVVEGSALIFVRLLHEFSFFAQRLDFRARGGKRQIQLRQFTLSGR